MPQLNYGQQPVAVVGQVATNEEPTIDTLINELLAQISVLTVGGTASAGDYVITATGPDGEVVTATFTRVAETNDGISDGLLAAVNDDDAWANIAEASDSGTDELTLTFVHPGRVYTIVTSAPGTGTLVSANSQNAGGTDIELGVVVAEGSADDLAAIVDAATVDDDFAGIVVRGIDALVNDFGEGGGTPNYGPDSAMSVLRRGECWVLVEDAVTKGGDVFVRTQNAGAGDPLGLMRSDADGGDAIAMTNARFSSSTTGRGLAKVRINRP